LVCGTGTFCGHRNPVRPQNDNDAMSTLVLTLAWLTMASLRVQSDVYASN
jgi:hypothetical protein